MFQSITAAVAVAASAAPKASPAPTAAPASPAVDAQAVYDQTSHALTAIGTINSSLANQISTLSIYVAVLLALATGIAALAFRIAVKEAATVAATAAAEKAAEAAAREAATTATTAATTAATAAAQVTFEATRKELEGQARDAIATVRGEATKNLEKALEDLRVISGHEIRLLSSENEKRLAAIHEEAQVHAETVRHQFMEAQASYRAQLDTEYLELKNEMRERLNQIADEQISSLEALVKKLPEVNEAQMQSFFAELRAEDEKRKKQFEARLNEMARTQDSSRSSVARSANSSKSNLATNLAAIPHIASLPDIPTIPNIQYPTIPTIQYPTIPTIQYPTIPHIPNPSTFELSPSTRAAIREFAQAAEAARLFNASFPRVDTNHGAVYRAALGDQAGYGKPKGSTEGEQEPDCEEDA